ncbi:hypothetical protein [Tardiphaga sp. vice154]|uniref:hypothetical protein n=2 Tax=Tardiphaga TaxID=1395974 RepID=UPI001AEEBE57|nr:hypothetical protein [Tardiphaga sp. vice154]
MISPEYPGAPGGIDRMGFPKRWLRQWRLEFWPRLIDPVGAEFAMKIKIVIHDAEKGGLWAEVPALPG